MFTLGGASLAKMVSFVEGKCVRHDQELNQLFKFALHFDIFIQKCFVTVCCLFLNWVIVESFCHQLFKTHGCNTHDTKVRK
jgi:hypothetical protein